MRLSEDEIRKLTLEAISQLGDKATPDSVKSVVEKSVAKLGALPTDTQKEIKDSGRIILTSFGINSPGIIAAITKTISEAKCDIRDMSQKIMDEFYTLIMVIDISTSPKDMREIQTELTNIGEELHVKIYVQHEDVFRQMHRI